MFWKILYLVISGLDHLHNRLYSGGGMTKIKIFSNWFSLIGSLLVIIPQVTLSLSNLHSELPAKPTQKNNNLKLKYPQQRSYPCP